MKKRIIALLLVSLMLTTLINICYANPEEAVTDEQSEVTREEIEKERPSLTAREATISMLLNGGWTMDEIDEWYTEEDLLNLDENAKAISNSTKYVVGYENAETKEVITEELTRQEFDYGLNQALCAEEDHDNTELSTVSSNGILELQPVYGWTDMDHITANDRLYLGFESGGYSGASIWNADDSCYLKQNMGLIWMANDTYAVQYRYEWKKEPYYTCMDHFAVALSTNLVVHENPRESFTFKYSMAGTEYIEKIVTGSEPTTTYPYGTKWCALRNVSYGQGRQVRINWPTRPQDNRGRSLKGYLTFYTKINDKYTYQEFIAYAQYYHGKIEVSPSASIGASISGTSVSFSISQGLNYTAESHPMEVRAKNIYMN